MIKFKNWLAPVFDTKLHERKYMPAGEAVEADYKEHFDENGVRSLVVDGQRNTYDEIQSHRDSVDINLIIKRYMNGDFTALDRANPVFMDISSMPSTFAEWLEAQARAKEYFYSLDPDVRAQFNNSYEQFLNGMIVPTKKEEVKKEEVKKEVSDESK